MENYNWEEFYEQYDNLLKNWLSSKKRKQMISDDCYFRAEEGKKRSDNVKLSDEELEIPEPYLGNPANCSAVIINLNPGMSGNGERKKFYTDLKKTLSSTTYSVWAKDFPHLDAYAPGYRFWIQKDRWIKRLCELNNKNAKNLKPFALELCPYHSKKWNGSFINDEVRDYIYQWVIKPAVAAVKQSQLPFALAIGKNCYTELKDNFGFIRVKLLKPSEDISNWPTNAKGKKTNRYFAILEKGGLKVLCTWSKGGTNSAPAESFREFEESLLKIFKPTTTTCKVGVGFCKTNI